MIIVSFMMLSALDHGILLYVWNLLGAYYIRSDIHLALQTHAAERQFHNWLFHVLLHDQLHEYYESMKFNTWSAHTTVTDRLRGALDLLVLRCVNRDLRTRCTAALDTKGVVLYDLVLASRPVRLLDHNIFNVPHHLLGVPPGQGRWDGIRTVFKRLRRALEEQHGSCNDNLFLLGFMLEKVCQKINAVRSTIRHYIPTTGLPH